MDNILSEVIKQWPTLALILILGFSFWKLFEKHLDENKKLMDEYRNIIEQKENGFKIISEQREKDYARNTQDRQKEIETLRVQFMALLEDGQKKQKQFEELKFDFSKISLENLALKRLIERLEEMMRATGGDVKVISTQLRKTQEDLETVSTQIQRIEYKSR